jgi:hypothetical protein
MRVSHSHPDSKLQCFKKYRPIDKPGSLDTAQQISTGNNAGRRFQPSGDATSIIIGNCHDALP